MWANNLSPFTPITITNVIEKNQTFLCELVNLKKDGFHHYTKAFNSLTYGFWEPMLKQSDDLITKLADDMKLTIRGK